MAEARDETDCQDVPLDPDEDMLPTSIGGIIGALAQRGCPDLTPYIDLTATNDRPSAGGGFSDVYRGVLRNGPNIAIKSMNVYEGSPLAGHNEGKKAVQRAAKEVYHWSRLRHPNILPLMGLAVFNGNLSMISEWMENGNLTSYLQREPDVDRIKLCMDICAGLCYIHTQGMIHGDLKGANILVSSNGVAMIADFGNAQLKDLTLKFSNNINRGVSIRWAAPELLEDGSPQGSMEADVYAYGMTVLEALTGKVPYEGASEIQVLTLVLVKGELPAHPDIAIPDDLWALLHSCWARNPSERPNATSIGDRLAALISPPGVPYYATEDIIGSATSIGEIIGALTTRGCPDLTSLIDLSASSDRPYAGGGFCDVYRGALLDGNTIAIKSLRVYESSFGGDSEMGRVLKRAARELYHWSKLNHRNVLPLMGLAFFKGYLSMISGWMENGNLTSYLRQNPGADRIKLCMDVCAGLSHIHMNGMVHGGLKGTNIMISQDGTAMVADFGNAQMRNITLQFSNTSKGALSIRWAAPELLEDIGPQGSMEADVYAYGMTVLEALTGKVPYAGASERQVLILVVAKRQVPYRPDRISDGLWDLLNSCWARDPSQRPGITSVGERLEALFPPPGVSLDIDEDMLESATSIGEIIGVLDRYGCPDLTSSLDLNACSDYPYATGGHNDVYQGSLYNGTRIAIKSSRSSYSEGDRDNQRALKRAAKQMYHWSKLNHRNILPLIGLAIFRGSISMITEWMDNGDLTVFLRHNPGADRIRLCMDICAGLCYMHTNGLVHGGVKGANIMISHDGTGMITGFEHAPLQDVIHPGSLSTRWMAPELLEDIESRGRSMEADVYAYGMTVLETLTGQVPYEGVNENRVAMLVVSRRVPLRPNIGIPDKLWELLNSCWASEPSSRPKITSVADYLKDIFLSPSPERTTSWS